MIKITREDYDVAVVGGGVGGVAAAVSAAREGLRVVLFEKFVVLGGLATEGLINWWEPLCNAQGVKLISGISEEILRRTLENSPGTLAAEWQKSGISRQETDKRYVSHFSPTVMALTLTDMLLEAGVTIRYDSLATYPEMKGDSVCGITVETKSGTEYFPCKIVIDASGDSTIFSRAGAECKCGKNFLSYVSHWVDFAEGKNMNAFDLRKWKVAGSGMTGKGHPEGMPLFDGVTSDEVCKYIIEGQKILFEKVKASDKNKREIVELPHMPQFRMIRHVVGDYEMTDADLYKVHEDSVGICGHFEHKGYWYELPYRVMYSPSLSNVLAAGRIISADGEAWNATRVIPVAAQTGDIAGMAAAEALRSGLPVNKIDVNALKKNLKEKREFKFHFDD